MKYLLFIFILSSSFAMQKNISVKQFSWLEGNWKEDGKDAFEKWQIDNDSLMAGMSYYFVWEGDEKNGEKEMMLSETIRLIVRGDKYFYIPLVRNQKIATEVEFEITSFTKNSFIAENPNHDFPQRIVYKLIDEKHLSAYIEGNQNGKNKKIDFLFTKVE